jgi:hypothetical protein
MGWPWSLSLMWTANAGPGFSLLGVSRGPARLRQPGVWLRCGAGGRRPHGDELRVVRADIAAETEGCVLRRRSTERLSRRLRCIYLPVGIGTTGELIEVRVARLDLQTIWPDSQLRCRWAE